MAAAVTRSGVMTAWRSWAHRHSTRLYGPSRRSSTLSWIGAERVAVGNLPTARSLPFLLDQGVTHVVNCRSRAQTWISQDLFVERAVFGSDHVLHAPMWDLGRPQPSALWWPAALYANAVLSDDPDARVLIHCQQGRHRSVMVAYAVLRLRGHDADTAVELILDHRHEARLLPAYRMSVERWLSTVAP